MIYALFATLLVSALVSPWIALLVFLVLGTKYLFLFYFIPERILYTVLSFGLGIMMVVDGVLTIICFGVYNFQFNSYYHRNVFHLAMSMRDLPPLPKP